MVDRTNSSAASSGRTPRAGLPEHRDDSGERRSTARAGPRRSPAPGERIRDAETSRRLLLNAALDEFAARGYAGARVQDIADRAGVNKQLINYYFGGKAGLYDGVQEIWQAPTEGDDMAVPLADLVVRYLNVALDDPRLIRLVLWRGLAGDEVDKTPPARRGFGPDGMRRRKERGELADGIDPRALMLVLVAAVSVPIAMPERVETITGMQVGSAEFADFYGEQLRVIVGCLTAEAATEDESAGRVRPSTRAAAQS